MPICRNALFVSNGIEQFDMRLESGRKEDALVWALEALSDGTIVSGDSYGRVQVSESNPDNIPAPVCRD